MTELEILQTIEYFGEDITNEMFELDFMLKKGELTQDEYDHIKSKVAEIHKEIEYKFDAERALDEESGLYNGIAVTEEDITDYFTRENFISMFGECNYSDNMLDRMRRIAFDRLY